MRRANSSMVCSSGFPCNTNKYFHYISGNKKHIKLLTFSLPLCAELILSLSLFNNTKCEKLTRLTGLLMLLFISNTRPFTRSLGTKGGLKLWFYIYFDSKTIVSPFSRMKKKPHLHKLESASIQHFFFICKETITVFSGV